MSEDPPVTNPYMPPMVSGEVADERLRYHIGRVYWSLMLAALVICSLMIFVPWYLVVLPRRGRFLAALFDTPPMPAGFFGCIAVGLGAVYGLCYLHRLARRRFDRRHRHIRAHQILFFVQSVAVGALVGLTSWTAFVSCCVPIGAMSLSYSAGGGMQGDLTFAVTLGIIVAIAAGVILVRLMLPKSDREEASTSQPPRPNDA